MSANHSLLCGIYRDDDSTASRCLALIERHAAFCMATDDKIRDVDGKAKRGPKAKKKTRGEIARIVEVCRQHPEATYRDLGEKLKVAEHVVRYTCQRFGLRKPTRTRKHLEVAA